jgi:hypothetical protein
MESRPGQFANSYSVAICRRFKSAIFASDVFTKLFIERIEQQRIDGLQFALPKQPFPLEWLTKQRARLLNCRRNDARTWTRDPSLEIDLPESKTWRGA